MVVAFHRFSGSRLSATVSPDSPHYGFAHAGRLAAPPGTRVLLARERLFLRIGLPPVMFMCGASRRCETKASSLRNFSSVEPYSLITASMVSTQIGRASCRERV